jgi:amino acid adenylation domain-containing protein
LKTPSGYSGPIGADETIAGIDKVTVAAIDHVAAALGVGPTAIIESAFRITLARFFNAKAIADPDMSLREVVHSLSDKRLNDRDVATLTLSDPDRNVWVLSCERSFELWRIRVRTDANRDALANETNVTAGFVTMLAAAVAEPGRPGVDLPLTDQAEAERLIAAADGEECPGFLGHSLDRLVAERARRFPEAVAIVDTQTSVTYEQLLDRAAAFVHVLRCEGAGVGSRIGVHSGVSVDFVSAVLAIWAVGGVFVPLDPMFPAARLHTVVADAGIELAFSTGEHLDGLTLSRVIAMNDVDDIDGAELQSAAEAAAVAYVVYTSGSTGTPKGVQITHEGAANAILAAVGIQALRPSDRTLYRTAVSFDLSVFDLFCTLVAGATLVIAPPSAVSDPGALIDLVAAFDITNLLLAPSLLAALLDRGAFALCTSLRVVTCGGEPLSWSLCERFFARSTATLFNLYGPSEAAMLVTLHACSPSDSHSGAATAPLGQALPNVHVSVRDARQWPVPPGAIGEIVIGGVQLASSYLARPEETERRFVRDPLHAQRRLYRTGDLARLQADGSLVYLGRNDKQIKIRGSRVEPGEVAATIELVSDIRTAYVCARHRAGALSDDVVLIAYVTLRDGVELTPAALRERLSGRLPSYMMPAKTIFLEEFPLTASGKIDEAALLDERYRTLDSGLSTSIAAQRNPETWSVRGIACEQLRTIWEALLDRKDVGDHDDFFELGGDSLLATRLMLILEESFDQRVPLVAFYGEMTIAALAALLANESSIDERDAVSFNANGSLPPFVYLHGDFGGGRYAWTLAKALGAHQPMTVISPHGSRGRPPVTDVPSMAADVVATLEREHPDGPFSIGGFSAAGLVAYEAARILQATGREVRDVILVATGAENVALAPLEAMLERVRLARPARESLLRRSANAFEAVRRFRQMRWTRRIERVANIVRGRRSPGATPFERELGDDYAVYALAHATYVPKSYPGPLAVLWPAKDRPTIDIVRDDWSRIAPQSRVLPVSGTHLGAVTRHLDEIAAAIRSRLSERNPIP